jgi:RNA polymerase sigma factor (sigma-70 family)
MNTALQSFRRFFDSLAFGAPGKVADAQLLDRFLTCRSEADDTAQAADRAFEELVARHGPLVRSVCRRLLDDPEDVEDAIQATFLVLFRRAAAVRTEASLAPWLCGVARRVATRARADRARRKAREAYRESSPVGEPADDACRAELRSIVGEEVGRLPPRYRGPVTLCLLEGLTYAEAARRLACPVNTLGVRLARGRDMLRGRLVRRGVASASAALILTPRSGHAGGAGGLVRLAAGGGGVVSARVAALVRKEMGFMSGLKARAIAAIVAGVMAVGGVAWVAVERERAAPDESGAVPFARVETGAAEPTGNRADPPSDVSELVEKHEENLKRIQSLTCTIELRVSEDGEKTWKTMTEGKFVRKGPVERVHFRYFWILDRDRIVRYDAVSDALLSPDGIRSMNGYYPDRPPPEPVTQADQSAAGGRISASLWPAQPSGPWGYKGALADDHRLLFLPDPRYSLRDLWRASPKVAPTDRRDDRGQRFLDMALKSPDGKIDYVVSLSPDRGYAIAETLSTQTDGARILKSADRVLEFQEPAPGIFLVKRSRQTLSWAPALVFETVIRDAAVNAPLADRDLALRFPEGVVVGDRRKGVWYVWGQGIPTRTFKTAQEFNEWTGGQLNQDAAPRPSAGADLPFLRYRALLQEMVADSLNYELEAQSAKKEADRREIVRRMRPDLAAFASRFLDLAKRDPKAPSSLHALARAATLNGSRVTEEAVGLLRKNWAANADVKAVVLPVGLAAALSPETEQFLREVLDRNPGKEAKAHAAYTLASYLYSLAELRNLHSRGPAEAAALKRQFGKEQVDRLLTRDAGAMLREAEGLMTRVESEFADVKLHPDRPKDTQTLGALARAWLGREDEPVLGRPAPAFEGTDLNGQPLRLNDYRGKVVVVVFWAGWCRPCMAMVPEEKALARRLADKPFALIGINCDATAGEARKLATEKAITWPNLHDGLPSEGKIAERYRVAGHGIPAIYVIDREGVLRQKWIASPGELERVVDALLAVGGEHCK